MTRILFVCLGNICRSPSAEGVFASCLQQSALAQQVQIDSAGTGGYHTGEPPDRRATAAALKRGYDLRAQRARAVADEDFSRFDLILAMDQSNLDNLRARAPANAKAQVGLFMAFAPGWSAEVPDPYYGGDDGFEQVLDMLEAASAGLLEHLAK
jgi:protein-tyrosine phosphatase|tara:strand:- start:61913 stop:62374 length:462 start_codon:yes stop_codon:yes gene_type:complete